MTKYTIKFITDDDNEETACALISKALGFDKTLSKNCLIFHFTFGRTFLNGSFKSKRIAEKTARRFEARGYYGGYSKFIGFEVVDCYDNLS